jgi:hypothetical protein
VLANQLGLGHQGFVANVEASGQVWNQPVYEFSSKVVGTRAPSKDSDPRTVREVLIHTVMTYADEIDPQWLPVVGTPKFNKSSKQYDYSLELDAAGRIVGGQYYLPSNKDHPGFIWMSPRLQFTGYGDGINRIYQPAQLPGQ